AGGCLLRDGRRGCRGRRRTGDHHDDLPHPSLGLRRRRKPAEVLMETSVSLLIWIIAIPAVSAAILLLGGKWTDAWGHLLGVASIVASFVLGVIAFAKLNNGSAEALTQHVGTWIDAGNFHVDFNLYFDPLSALFVLLITGVGGLIHIYSVGYMAHDDRRR